MKRVKVTIKPDSPGRTFPLFSSVEAAYVWLTEAYDDPQVLDRIEGVEKLSLYPGEFIEAEWVGCEFSYDGNDSTRVDLVHLVKGQAAKNAAGAVVSPHSGWLVDCIIPFKDYEDNDITVTVLHPGDKQLDMSTLFADED